MPHGKDVPGRTKHMKITVKQLKGLIREAAAEAMEEMASSSEEKLDECNDTMEEAAPITEEQLNEAVAKAYRHGFRRGAEAAVAKGKAAPAAKKPAAPAKR